MNCGATTVKYLLFIFNFVFFISGVGILVVGALVKSNEPSYSEISNTNLYGVSVLLIVVGCCVAVIAFFGCCGAIRESRCMLYTFAVFLSIIFIVEFAGGITAFVYREDLQKDIRQQMEKTMKAYDPAMTNSSNTISWNDLQHNLKCCGMNNYKDWKEVPAVKTLAPKSCCKSNESSCEDDETKIYTRGCFPLLEEQISNHALIIGAVGIGVAFIQILGIVFACCLASILKN